MNQLPMSDEDKLDRFYMFTSLTLLFVGLAFATSAMLTFAEQDSDFEQLASLSRTIFLITIPALAVLTLWHSVGIKRRGESLWLDEGFIHRAYVRAITISWTSTFLGLTLLMELLEDTALPPKFYMRTVGAILLIVFSLSYLIISNSSQADEGEEA